MEYIITNIEYDTDGEDNLNLPKTLQIIVPDDLHDYEEVEQFISDEISNRTGYCHKGFTTNPEIKE